MSNSNQQPANCSGPTAQQIEVIDALTAELLRLPLVREVVVVVLPNQVLQAFIVPAQAEVRGVATTIMESLTPTLRPQSITLLSALPRDQNGVVEQHILFNISALDDEICAQAESYARSVVGMTAAAVLKRSDPLISKAILLSELIPQMLVGKTASEREKRRLTDSSSSSAGDVTESSELLLVQPSSTTKLSLVQGVALLSEVDAPQTVAQMLRRAAAGAHGITYVERWLNDQNKDASTVSYASLLHDAERVLAGLRAQGLQPQQRLLVQLERNQDFVTLFWACTLGGFVVVPLAIPPSYRENSSALSRLRNAWEMLDQPFIVTSSAACAELMTSGPALGMTHVRVLDISALNRCAPDHQWHAVKPDDIAILLLTSGSTGKPKAVIQTNRSLCAFSAAARQEIRITPSDVSLNWMPLDHVGGLVMFHLRDVYSACQQILAPTAIILEDPLRWLALIDRYRATLTWSPNFGYALVTDHATRIAEQTWDLSCMRFMLNGGEAVVARTVRRFLALLAPHGLPDTTVHPAWGMSETSSGVTYSQCCSSASISDDLPCVEVGGPMPTISLRIVDVNNQVLAEERTGRLQVCGPCITPGYFQHDEANKESFTADGWFITGDLGVIRDGRLTITGREKDVIIINGINFIAHEIESVVEDVAGVATSFAAACAVREKNADTDSLAIFFSPADDESEPFNRDLLG